MVAHHASRALGGAPAHRRPHQRRRGLRCPQARTADRRPGGRTHASSGTRRFFAGAVRCQSGALAGEYLAGHTSMIRRDPVGVVASIAPWNYP
ncbi:MAG: aldehyde dehydrogenase family protein [Amaricoccus sp.]